ncbi:MAG: hypothetical protein OEV40_18715 [Acidimicrobiia bacterium]|nr:hypothetical protein [Acidimicrobiia bacterium]
MRRLAVVLLILATIFGMATPAVAAEATITLENPPPGGVLELAVGESHTFDITVSSDETFVVAIALTDQFFPGRGVFFAGSDRETMSTSADLQLTITGKQATDFLPEGVAPVAIVVGVRYKGGVVVSERFDFVVDVT